MDYFLMLCSSIIYIENRIQGDIDYSELEKETGYSLAHIRDLFSNQMGMTLSRYILERKISNAAFDVVYGDDSIVSIADIHVDFNFIFWFYVT